MGKRNVTISLIPSGEIPEEVCRFFAQTPDAVCRMNGKLYCMTGQDALSCEDSAVGNELFAALQQKYLSGGNGSGHPRDFWYQILTSAESYRITEIAKKHAIEDQKKRIVILFRPRYPFDQDLFRIFAEIAPMEKGDHPVSMDHDMVALIKDTAFRSEDEISEYAAAVIDTMVSEGYTDLQAGIGSEAEMICELPRSYDEALNALLTGARYHPDETLFRYSEQKLERIIDLIPPESRRKIFAEFSSRCKCEAFSDEMMETVKVFFEHDLNITSASRELFIHRNTLNYRLDKIKRDTGLDLRTFQDAVIFRLISGMTEKV